MASPGLEKMSEDFQSQMSLEQMMAQAGAQMPPAMADMKQYSADEVLAEMNKMPLFMTSLDNIDGPDGDNPQLEALRALAYEGTRAEIAANFREQGNEAAREKRWKDAREYYDRALETLRMSDDQLMEAKGGEGPSELQVVELDSEEEKIKESEVLEASHVNRALCNLEMSMAPLERWLVVFKTLTKYRELRFMSARLCCCHNTEP